VVGNNRNACVRVPVSEKCDLFGCDGKIIAGMDNKIEREMKFGFAWAQIIGARYRSRIREFAARNILTSPS
jgi:hypothetical protein